ncbi:MAG: hypothetical protein A3F11_07680 [Gammaproteobacteria bacterium RIFCSPHIGHO2_12_FULL_37_14]|nr:MAG: hypothetical protein A3F11_07680 [Gammaproteobacteria bacterium RIFCSPHIGHO2_12_FULL_37_14]
MKKILLLTSILLAFMFSGCSLFRVHKLDIEQGNVITQENIAQLHQGMSEAEVKSIMGNPILINVFTPERLNYVYSYKKGYEKMATQRVILIFQRGRLQEIMNSKEI